jgi:HTH-type transcriptional regulator, sugar sensing transcriptional regulator
MHINELTELGLSESEARVYLAGLELGPASIQEIAEKTKQNRTSLYHTIGQLVHKKLFTNSSRGKKKVYVAEPPESLKALLHIKLKRLDTILGDLRALANTGSIKPVITFYEGFDGIKTVFLQALICKEKTFYAVAGIQRLNMRSKALLDFWLNEFAPLRKKHGIITKLVVPDTEQGKEYKKSDEEKFRETRFVPSSTYNFDCEFMIHDEVVDFFVYSEREQFAISIKSAAIAQTLKLVWQIVWKQAYNLQKVA